MAFSRRFLFGGLILAVGLGLAGVVFHWTELPSKAPTTISPTALYATEFRNPLDEPVTLGRWQGKVLLVNFWATWCAPCREEIPHLVEAQERHTAEGVQVIGIAIDPPDKIGPFSRKMGMNYPVLVGAEGGIELSKRLGNRVGVLPFTAVVDRQGRVVFATAGSLTSEQIEEQIQKTIRPAAEAG